MYNFLFFILAALLFAKLQIISFLCIRDILHVPDGSNSNGLSANEYSPMRSRTDGDFVNRIGCWRV